jgi:hypothetical protein
MKKIFICLLWLMPLAAFSQVGRLPYDTIRQEYKGDTCTQFFSGDSAKWYTSKGNFSFDKPIYGTYLFAGGDSVSTWPGVRTYFSSHSQNIYAGNGLTKDGDTIKFGGSISGKSHYNFIYADSTNTMFVLNHYNLNSQVGLFIQYDPNSYNHIKFHANGELSQSNTDATYDTTGFQYVDNLASINTNNPRWIPDKNYVDSIVSSPHLSDFYSDVSNSDSSETDLYTFTLPANSLINNGDKLEIFYSVYVTDNVASNIIALYFGNSSLSTLYADALSTTNETVNYKLLLIRTSSSTLRYNLTIESSDYHAYLNYDLSSLDFTTTQVIKVTGTGTTSGVIVAKMGTITYIPAN